MGKTRILLIDDEASFTHLLKVNLEETNRYEARVENRGAWALAAALEFRPDVIFLDVIMPDMDGSEVAAQMRAEPQLKHVPIVFLTAIVSPWEAKNHHGMIGGCPFLAKPVSLDRVIACIEQQVRNGGALARHTPHP